MTKDEIWKKIKNDTSEIYGQSIFDAFIKITDNLKREHFLELSNDQKKTITTDAINSLLKSDGYRKYVTSDLLKWLNILNDNIEKLSEMSVYNILLANGPKEDIENLAKLIGQDNINKLNNHNIINLFIYTQYPKTIAKIIKDKINKLSLNDISSLLFNYAEIRNNYDEMVEIILKYIKLDSGIIQFLLLYEKDYKRNELCKKIISHKELANEELSEKDVFNLFYYSEGDVADLLGSKNINKLTNQNILTLMNSVYVPSSITKKILQKYLVDKEKLEILDKFYSQS